MPTRVKLQNHPADPRMKVAHVTVPMLVGDVPGSLRISCANDSLCGALAGAAQMAHQVLNDPAVGAVVPDNTREELSAMYDVSLAARAGLPVLHAASLQMTRGQRRLARALSNEARTFGGPDDVEAQEVGGFFDSISSLAKKLANTVVDYGDPDHWPDWMKKVAKPLGRAALDAAATAVLGPAGPVAVETMIHVVDSAQSGDPAAQKQLESIAKKAIAGDKKAKVLMSAVHLAGAPGDDAKHAADNSTALVVGDAADDYMAMYGAAYDPRTWEAADQGDQGDQAYDDDAYYGNAQQYDQGDDGYGDDGYGDDGYGDDGYGDQGDQGDDAPPPVIRDHRQSAQQQQQQQNAPIRPMTNPQGRGGVTVTPTGGTRGGTRGKPGPSLWQQYNSRKSGKGGGGRDHRGH